MSSEPKNLFTGINSLDNRLTNNEIENKLLLISGASHTTSLLLQTAYFFLNPKEGKKKKQSKRYCVYILVGKGKDNLEMTVKDQKQLESVLEDDHYKIMEDSGGDARDLLANIKEELDSYEDNEEERELLVIIDSIEGILNRYAETGPFERIGGIKSFIQKIKKKLGEIQGQKESFRLLVSFNPSRSLKESLRVKQRIIEIADITIEIEGEKRDFGPQLFLRPHFSAFPVHCIETENHEEYKLVQTDQITPETFEPETFEGSNGYQLPLKLPKRGQMGGEGNWKNLKIDTESPHIVNIVHPWSTVYMYKWIMFFIINSLKNENQVLYVSLDDIPVALAKTEIKEGEFFHQKLKKWEHGKDISLLNGISEVEENVKDEFGEDEGTGLIRESSKPGNIDLLFNDMLQWIHNNKDQDKKGIILLLNSFAYLSGTLGYDKAVGVLLDLFSSFGRTRSEGGSRILLNVVPRKMFNDYEYGRLTQTADYQIRFDQRTIKTEQITSITLSGFEDFRGGISVPVKFHNSFRAITLVPSALEGTEINEKL